MCENAVPLDEQDDEGNTPLHLAVQHGALECARHLLHASASMEITNREGFTPLQEVFFSSSASFFLFANLCF